MARITASVYTSHVPAIGAAMDLGKAGEPYWQKVFAGYEFSRQWMKENTPDVVFLVFNDHATAFSLEMIPTFAHPLLTSPLPLFSAAASHRPSLAPPSPVPVVLSPFPFFSLCFRLGDQ